MGVRASEVSRFLRGHARAEPRRANPEPQTVSVEERMCALRDYVQALLEPDMDVFGVQRVVLWSGPEHWRLMYALRSAAPVPWLILDPRNDLRFDPKSDSGTVPTFPASLWTVAIAWGGRVLPEAREFPAALRLPLHAGAAYDMPVALWPNLRARRPEIASIGWAPRVLPSARGSRRAGWSRNTSLLERTIESEIERVRDEGWLPSTLRAGAWVKAQGMPSSAETWDVQVNVLDCAGVALFEPGGVNNGEVLETSAHRAIQKTLVSVVERFEVATGRAMFLPSVAMAPMNSHQAQEREFLRARKAGRAAQDLRLSSTLRTAMRDRGCENDALKATVAPDGQWRLTYQPAYDSEPSVTADVESVADAWEVVQGWIEEFN